jgi:hypothetical protein
MITLLFATRAAVLALGFAGPAVACDLHGDGGMFGGFGIHQWHQEPVYSASAIAAARAAPNTAVERMEKLRAELLARTPGLARAVTPAKAAEPRDSAD